MRRREFIAGVGGAAAWPFARGRSSGADAAVGVLMAFDENDPQQEAGSPTSRRGLRSWVGQTAVPCGLTFVGPPAALTGCGPSRKSWSNCGPT